MLLPIPIYIYILSARECNSQQKSDNLRGKRRRVIRNETRTVSLQSIKYIYIYIYIILCTAAVFIVKDHNKIGRARCVLYKTSMVVSARRP